MKTRLKGIVKLLCLALLAVLQSPDCLFAQPGLLGPRTITVANTIVNAYTSLTKDAAAGSSVLTVLSNSMTGNGIFSGNLAAGDLVLVIQMQGATINVNNADADYLGYGTITAMNNAGNYEFACVSSTSNSLPSTITLVSPLTNSYSSAGKAQVVRVPRFTTLTMNEFSSIVASAWDGSTGGIVVVETMGDISLAIASFISANGSGFRGGALSTNTGTPGNATDWVSALVQNGGNKGESIAGNSTIYATLGGQYGKGPPANGGGGGTDQNSGGGGGANGDNGVFYSGTGIPSANIFWTSAWNLESHLNTQSSGGGRGGYTRSTNNEDARFTSPGAASWGGDNRRNQGGYGGHPLDYSSGRVFMGGGGGAGESDNDAFASGGKGGDGGGIVLIVTRGNITGTGAIVANGSAGQNARNILGGSHGGAGGGGGGGALLIFQTSANNSIASSVALSANGGAGGNQTLAALEADGPGGGGGGGYIGITRSTPGTPTVSAGSNGTTSSTSLTEFPPNGATAGAAGQIAYNITKPGLIHNLEGRVYIDPNGLTDGSINGTGPGSLAQLYISAAVNGTLVEATVPVSAGGQFFFPFILGPGIYSFVLHTNPAGQTTASLPPFYVNSGEGITAAGDGSPNGVVIVVIDQCSSPTNLLFGITAVNTWTGTGNWSDGTHWSAGHAPTATENIVISTGTPTLDIDYTLPVGQTMMMSNGTSLVVSPNKILAIAGVADFNGQLVVFKSDASGSGAFGTLTGSLSGNTNVTVERYIPATGRAWRLLTIPVTGTGTIRNAWANGRVPIATIAAAANEPPGFGTLITANMPGSAATANAAGFDYIQLPGATSSIRKYVSGDWPPTAAGTPAMTTNYNTAEEGYMLFVRGDRRNVAGVVDIHETILRPTGALKTGTKNYALSAGLVKLIGNPYASAIDFATVYGHNGTIAEKRFWRWDANNNTNGAYVIVQDDGLGGWETIPNGESLINVTQIHSGQAIFVRGGTGGAFQIRESDKVPAGTSVTLPVVFDVPVSIGKLFTNMYLDNGADGLQLVDGIQGRFADGNVIDIDANDVGKVNNFNENIALLRNGKALSVEAHPWVAGEDILYLSTTNLEARNYAFQFKSVKMQPGLTAILQDTHLGKESEISTADNELTTYNFTVTADAASAASDRFRIVFKAGLLPLSLTSAKAYSLNNGVQVDWKTVNEKGIKSYEVEKSIDGRSFSKTTSVTAIGGAENNYGWFDAAPFNGDNYYRIKLIGTDGKISYSSVLKLTLHDTRPASITLYPNPVKDSKLTLELTNMEKGKYTMSVFNSTGQLVMNKIINHQGGSSTEEIKLTDNFAAGVYRVSLSDAKGISLEQSIVVQR